MSNPHLFPIVPAGTVPACYSCRRPTAEDSEEASGFTVGRGARKVDCPNCGKTTYFDVDPKASKETK
ncbi:MAG: hypothetical protein ABL984_00380 [Pyrinomonadaceae bacterium]